ncbi:MAG: TetR/AcrR family transcriptional regulator [Aquimonas sp.]|nr:TetR/AcrR family transcriptional regulator [Aquimonas sp.]
MQPVHPPKGPGRPKDPEKRAAILEAAKRLFPLRGFEGVSMDAIAAEAGVSKLTVYSHFQDKDTLFAAAVKAKCEEQLPETVFRVEPGRGPIREQLRAIATGFHALILSTESVSFYRMMAAQGEANGKLAELFYEAGPRRILGAFEAFLIAANHAGSLEVPDPRRAAGHFFCLIKGETHMRQLIGCPVCGLDCEGPEHIESVLDLFLRAYALRAAG